MSETSYISTRAPQTEDHKSIRDELLPHLALARLRDYVFDEVQLENLYWNVDDMEFPEDEVEEMRLAWLQRVHPDAAAESAAPAPFLRQVFAGEWEEELKALQGVRSQACAHRFFMESLPRVDWREVDEREIEGVLYWLCADSSGGSYPPDSYLPVSFLAESCIFDTFFTAEEIEAAETVLANPPYSTLREAGVDTAALMAYT